MVGRVMADVLWFCITVLDDRPCQRLGWHPRTLMYRVPYYFRPWEWRGLYGGTAKLWSELDEIRTSGEVSGRWLRNQNQSAECTVVPSKADAALPVEAQATYAFLILLRCIAYLLQISIINLKVNVLPLPAGPWKNMCMGSLSGVWILK